VFLLIEVGMFCIDSLAQLTFRIGLSLSIWLGELVLVPTSSTGSYF